LEIELPFTTYQLPITHPKGVEMKPAIIVHGGAWDIPQDEHEAHKQGCRAAVLAGYRILAEGGTALDAVETAVTMLEDAPIFDAGTGSHLNQAGVVQLDAGMMDGATLQVGAVAGVERLKNPIQVTRLLLTSPHNMFVGEGAVTWATKHGFTPIDPGQLVVDRELGRYQKYLEKDKTGPASRQPDGTVGAVAIDREGNLVAGTSTGGTRVKPVGRVGDSPLPGCGYYADNETAAVSSTGHGESIIRVQLAYRAAHFARQFSQEGPASGPFCAAAEAAIDILVRRVEGLGGVIMIDRQGRVGFAHNTPHLARAFFSEGMSEPEVGI
jgi:beta-aspartyl-peptidase (threonine type)